MNRNYWPNRKGVCHEEKYEESGKQTPGPRNTNRMRGVVLMGERANRLEAQCHSDRVGVYAGGYLGEKSRVLS